MSQDQDRYKIFFESSADAMMTIDGGIFVDCNPATVKMLGYDSKEEVIGKTPDEISPPIQPDGSISAVKATEMLETTFRVGTNRFEWMHIDKDNNLFPVEVLLIRVPEGGKDLIKVVWHDISLRHQLREEIEERKRVEQTLLTSEQHSKKNAEMFRAVIDGAPDAIFVVDITSDNAGKFVDVNAAACINLGYTREELLKMSVPDIEVGISQQDRDENYQILNTRKLSQMTGVHRRKDGTTFPVSINNKTFEDGERIYSVALVRDETEWQKIENDLRIAGEKAEHARREAEAANQIKSDFLANMSHELRSPLTSIIGFTEMMRGEFYGPIDNEKYSDYLDSIHVSGTHLSNLISDLLDISAIEEGRLELFEETVEIKEVVVSSYIIVQPRANVGKINFTIEMDKKLPIILVDSRRFKQILVNLLTNAIKFTPEGGSVNLGVDIENDGSLQIVVKDTGIGMDENGIAKALTKFGQIDSEQSRKHQGTGLGLPLTKELVEMHGGSMLIDSDLGSGTTIKVLIPKDRVMH